MISADLILRLIAKSSATGFERSLLLYYHIDDREFRLRSTYNIVSLWPGKGDKLTIGMRSSAGFVIKAVMLGQESLRRTAGISGLDVVAFQYDPNNCQIEVDLDRHMDRTRASLRETMEHHLMMLTLGYSE